MKKNKVVYFRRIPKRQKYDFISEKEAKCLDRKIGGASCAYFSQLICASNRG